MTAVAVLGTIALALLLPLGVAAARQPTLMAMALRTISRRRSEAALVVGGALLGTAIITSSFVVGDVVEGSFTDAARTRLGPIDITVTPADGADLAAVRTAIETAGISGIDGVLPATTATATLEAPQRDAAVPQVVLLELDLVAAGEFGPDPRITGLADIETLGADQIVMSTRTAQQLQVAAGESVRVHAYGHAADLMLSEVVPEVGIAGYGGAIVAPGTIERLAAVAPASAAPPRSHLLVSLDGGVIDTRALSDAAVTSLRAAVAEVPDVEVTADKAAILDDARREGAAFTELFSIIGAFSVLAGVLLLVNLFVMLAEERKTELGMLRAIGFTRRRLVRAFAIEGAVYAVLAAVIGAVVGIGIGWVVAVVAGRLLGLAEQGAAYPLVIEPVSLAIGATTGLIISLLTIWATSIRIARLNIIRAIRDLPEPTLSRPRARTAAVAALTVLVGAALAVTGYLGEAGIPLLLGVPIAAFGVTPLLRRLLPARVARLLTSGTVLMWGLVAPALFPDAMGVADPALFVLQGVVLTAGAVSSAVSLDRVWGLLVTRLGGRGLVPRLAIAYPLARRFRTALLLGMFSLVIFTVTILATWTATFERNTDVAARDVAAGFDVVLDASPANPIDAADLRARDDVIAVASVRRGVADFGADHLDGSRAWAVTGIDADLLARGTPALALRAATYPSDEAVYRAVIADPTLVIAPDGFLVGVGATEIGLGDTVAFLDPAGGRARQLTVVGLGTLDWVGNGALVSSELTTSMLGEQDVVSRSYVAVADGTDPEAVAADLTRSFLPHGADATTFEALVTEAMRQQTGLLALLQGFLGLGLLVGTAGLGVVMIRAVRERRQEVGMLRAIGLRAGLVRGALLTEAGLIAVQGTLIGAVLGLLTTRQLLTSFGEDMPFTIPWVGLALIVALPLAASLAATAWPASRAAAISPAVALRTAD
ncbi:hypothetical protein BH23ACT9_BH23ACT9_28520 [soil metagenome]